MIDTVYIVWELVSDQYGTEKIIDVFFRESLAVTCAGQGGSLRRIEIRKTKDKL